MGTECLETPAENSPAQHSTTAVGSSHYSTEHAAGGRLGCWSAADVSCSFSKFNRSESTNTCNAVLFVVLFFFFSQKYFTQESFSSSKAQAVGRCCLAVLRCLQGQQGCSSRMALPCTKHCCASLGVDMLWAFNPCCAPISQKCGFLGSVSEALPSYFSFVLLVGHTACHLQQGQRSRAKDGLFHSIWKCEFQIL